MGNTLDAPNTAKDSHHCESSTGIVVGASGMQGWRLEMEDAHISQDMPSRLDHVFLAVFDGHAGSGAAKFASDNFVSFLEASKGWKAYLASDCKDIKALADALASTFLEVDEKLRSNQDASQGRDSSGCTSVTAMITPTHVLCANAGDSRCVLGTGDGTKPMSSDHKPYNEFEKRRIEAAGGFVQWNRVDGDLAVSRALGDFSYKTRPDLDPREQKITCFPDVTIHERTEGDDVLILACDGLWDVMSSEEAVNTARRIFASGETSMVKIAEEMLDLALDKGSKDNISAVVARLPGARLGPASNGGVDALRAERNATKQTTASEPASY